MSDYPESEFEQRRTFERRRRYHPLGRSAELLAWIEGLIAAGKYVHRDLEWEARWLQTVDSSSSSKATQSGIALRALEERGPVQPNPSPEPSWDKGLNQ